MKQYHENGSRAGWTWSLSRIKCWLAVCWILVLLGAAGWLVDGRMPAVSAGIHAPHTQGAAWADPNAACAGCHREIYERYRKTPMANGSGPAATGFVPAEFTHEISGISYRITEESGRVYLDFERRAGVSGGNSTLAAQELKGRRELKYFLGSGKRGRTYLFEQEGYWFEIPINWYAKKKVWDMAPGYLQAREMPLALPVDPGCVRCHASEAQASMPEARNRYAGEPFEQGGVTCAACHGDAAAHMASAGKVALTKIGEMAPVRRDSVCLSCHLEGQVAVVHTGKRLVDFRPGDNIFEFISYYVRKPDVSRVSSVSGELDRRATSQWEALLTSGCKRGAGEKLTCTSCHDPHGTAAAMSAQERVNFYRQKCLACHESGTGSARQVNFAATHHAENPDCTSCHMPRAATGDIAHEQVTDHRIPRVRTAPHTQGNVAGGELVAVGDGANGSAREMNDLELKRDLGLAYAQAAARGDQTAANRARDLLREAEAMPGGAADAEMHEQLGFLEQLGGDKDAAGREYGLALAADADDAFAAGNLALIRAQERQYTAAVPLWEKAFRDDPVRLQAGMNLAIVQCGLGQREAAQGTLERILEFSPDDGKARTMLLEIRSKARPCQAR
jgi:tetratricopeptide (TPR) repeat protein